MDIESNSSSKDSMDSVAQALMNIFEKKEEVIEDHTLSVFLIKVYKNNISNKAKRMNSIRLSRFNAFLYRVNSNYPHSQNANTVILSSVMAMLANQNNFKEEEDEQTIVSIAKWISQALLNATQRGFYEMVQIFLKYLINDEKPKLNDITHFEELLRSQAYFGGIELSSEDEVAARDFSHYYNITETFSIKNYVLSEIKITEIYSNIFQHLPSKKQIVKLFNKHLQKITPKEKPSEMFSKIFITKQPESSYEVEAILEAFEQNYFNNQSVIKNLEILIKKTENISLYFNVAFKDTKTEKLFLQLLNQHWKSKNIQLLIDAFLSASSVRNLSILYLLINSESTIPKKYIELLFTQTPALLKYQHTLILSLALANHNDKKTSSELIESYERNSSSLAPQQRALIINAILYSFTSQDKKQLYFNIMNQASAACFGTDPSFSLLPSAELKSDKINGEDRKKLFKILQNYSDNSQNAMKIKADLLGLCNYNISPTKKIKQLNSLIQKPYEEIFKFITEDNIKRDPELIATLLMALNNKLYLNFISQPKFEIVQQIAGIYLDMHQSFGKSLGRIDNQDRHSKKSIYYAALFRYGLHSKQKIGTISGELGQLLSGTCNYRRVNGVDFADYLIRQDQKRGIVGQLWTGKKIIMELRKLIETIVNFNGAGSGERKKQLKGLFESQWIYPLAFDVIQTYIQGDVHDPAVLRQILAIMQPTYDFFQKVQKSFISQFDEYIDILFYTPELLRQIYPDMIKFLASLITSEPEKKDKEKEKQKNFKKQKKKTGKKKIIEKENTKNNNQYSASSDYIFDNASLFETISKRKELNAIFGDSALLMSFSPLIKVIKKVNDPVKRMQKICNEWLATVKVFHCQRMDLIQQWISKVISYCELWNVFLVQKQYKFQTKELERHFHILTEFLNILYQSRRPLPEVQEIILITLLLIYQASSNSKPFQVPQIPIESLKNFFLGYRLSTPNEQHYYQCFTCNLPICQICMPFLHKNHDVNYLGKDGYCVHDSTQKKKSDREDQRSLREERAPRQARQPRQPRQPREPGFQREPGCMRERQMERYQNLSNMNVFQPPPSLAYGQAGLMRNPRREDDWLMSTFEFPDEQMNFNEHLRFKQAMELRIRQQRDRQRQRQKELLFSRERQRMDRQRQQILMIFEKDSKILQVPDQNEEIKSCSSKSIKNLHFGHINKQYFTPQFAPLPEIQGNYPSSIDTKPLRCILLRQLQTQGTQENNRVEKGKTTLTIQNERYNFFNKSNYFKSNNRPEFGMMRGLGMNNLAKKNLLTCNNKVLAFPTPNNGVIILALTNIIAKMNKRIQLKAFGDFEQERGYLAGSINNTNFSFEPFQILFNKNNPNLMAIIGLSQLGFALLSNDSKLQKYSDSDFKSTQPITKFTWLSKHKNIFAVATGNSIRLGHVSDDGRIKTANRFRVNIQKLIRDFQINNENGSLYIYIIDVEGGFYRAEFDYRGAKTINIAQKKLIYAQNLEQLQSLVFADRKLLLTSSNGKCYLLNVENKQASPTFIQSFDFQTLIKNNENTKFIKFPSYLCQLQLIQNTEGLFSIGCILKKVAGDPKRRGGYLFVIRINQKNSLQMILLCQEQTIQSYEVTELGENNFLITAVDEFGSVFCFNYQIPGQLFNLRQDTKIPIDQNSIKTCNRLIKSNNLLALAKYYEPKRYENFKQSKDLTASYKISIDNSSNIKILTDNPNKYFWTGLSFMVEPSNIPTELEFSLFGRKYSYKISKARQIQIPFNIKQTIQLFISDGEFILELNMKNAKQIKNCRVYGMDYTAESLYKKAYLHLHKIVITHLQFNQNNVEHYLENSDRHSLVALDLTKLPDLKASQKYTNKQLNLLMKLELLRQSIEGSLKMEGNLEETLDIVRNYLLPQCQKRQYLEKSCWKLIRRICQLALPQSKGISGHPLEYRTILDFYYFEVCLTQWSNTHQINHFEQLINILFALIFKRIGNLYIIFKIYPDLIYELTYYYKNLLQAMKFSKNESKDHAQLQKLVKICPNFVALICEYYQTLKNTSNKMIDQYNEQDDCPENIILSLLEQVFCATRKELYREVFISPEVYLQRLYLSPKQPHSLSSAISIFQIRDKKHDNFQSLKKNGAEDQDNQKSEDYLQLEEQSQKQMVVEQQARQMIEVSSEYQECSNEMQAEKLTNQQKFKRVYQLLNNNLLPRGTQLHFTYYQFSFQMAIALFTLTGYITQQNSVFYVGFLFNLLRILEMNIEPVRDAVYIKEFFAAIHSKIYSQHHSVLYMVINYFFEPNYIHKTMFEQRKIQPSPSKLSKYFLNYLLNECISIEDLFLNFDIKKTDKLVSFGEAMKFNTFSIENQLYQLKFLGNLYFNVKLTGKLRSTENEVFKYKILGGFIRYNLRILKNIMYFEEWQNELQEARVQVGFQTLATKVSEGINILTSCSKSEPVIFIKKLSACPSKIKCLEDLLERQDVDSMKVIEMLTIYYNS